MFLSVYQCEKSPGESAGRKQHLYSHFSCFTQKHTDSSPTHSPSHFKG